VPAETDSPFRFSPPRIDWRPELIWLLRRAFAPNGATALALPPVAGEETVDLARRLDLASRVAARTARARLSAEIGEHAAERLAAERRAAAAQGVRVLALAERIAGEAEALGARVALLKFAALAARGVEMVGRRSVADLDLLASESDALRLARRLRELGFAPSSAPAPEQHLATLAGDDGVVEIHTRLLGVRLAGGRSATLAELEAAGALAPWSERPALCVPSREILVAHLLVHAFAQHAPAPYAYPLLRGLGDLLDLRAVAGDARAVAGWLERDLEAADVSAILELAGILARGELGELAGRPDLWLRHAIGGAIDPDYVAALRWTAATAPVPSDRARWARGWSSLAGLVFPSRRRLEAQHGRQASAWELAGWRVARPFELARRALAAAVGRSRLAARRKRESKSGHG
jgi:hypothetical protein